MNSDQAKQKVVYRLATRAEWAQALETGRVPLREIDRDDGYIHLSTRDQLLETARLHFAGEHDLLALAIPLERIAAHLKFELAPKRGEEFPHLYAPLDTALVIQALHLVSSGNGFAIGDAL